MQIKKEKDFWAGIMFMTFGAFFACVGMQYRIGIAAKMGPGYFPTVLGVIVILLGIVMSVGALFGKITDEKVVKFHLPTLLLILGSIVMFGLLLKPFGLIFSMLILIAISSYASNEFSWKATLLSAVVLIVICLVVFVWLVNLEFQLWPSFIGN